MLAELSTVLLAAIGSFGIVVAVVGYLTVFFALVLSYLVFNNLPKLYKIRIRKNYRRQRKKGTGQEGDEECCVDITGQTTAAISLAMHLYFNELHDNEDMVMTIKKVSKQYSPWSSKIYGLNNLNYRNR